MLENWPEQIALAYLTENLVRDLAWVGLEMGFFEEVCAKLWV